MMADDLKPCIPDSLDFLVSRMQNHFWESVVRLLSRVWLYNSVDCSMPGLPVRHQLPELVQPHVHWVGDAIQPSQPLPPPSPPDLSLSEQVDLG